MTGFEILGVDLTWTDVAFVAGVLVFLVVMNYLNGARWRR